MRRVRRLQRHWRARRRRKIKTKTKRGTHKRERQHRQEIQAGEDAR